MPPMRVVELVDPSQVLRPETKYNDLNINLRMKKDGQKFRDFTNNIQTEVAKKTYREMHTYQTVELVNEKKKKWLSLEHDEMPIMDALFLLDNLVDESDPDTDLPNSVHAFQTAERIREKHPDKDWFHLTGLIHDLGKVMAIWGEPQHFVVGDTFPVGCCHDTSIVLHEYFAENVDSQNPVYSTKYGMYTPNCGLENVMMSWGHDEYMYQVLTKNQCTLPEESLYMIRYHSFYPWHCEGAYTHLTNEKDETMLPWVIEFNKFDLYSKSDGLPDVEALIPYYQTLIDKYCPGKLKW